jgi:CBS domain-containing protein
MNVSEIMANIVQVVDREQSLNKVASIMKDYDIGCVVVGTESRLDGLVTDRDLVCRGLASGKSLDSMKVADVMTSSPVWCRADDTVKQAASIMERGQVRRLPVLDFDNRLVGIVSLGDICTHAPAELAGELIEVVSRPEHHSLAETA